MLVVENLRSKRLYKLFILCIKYFPVIIAFCYIANTVSLYFNYSICPLSNIAGVSLLSWIFLYTTSIVFQFCVYHRFLLWYILADDVINIVDFYCYIPCSLDTIFILHNILLGILVLFVLWKHVKNNKIPFTEDNR